MASSVPPTEQTVRIDPATVRRASPSPLAVVLELIRRARSADSLAALRFIAVNDSHLLAPYHQSILWTAEGGIEAISGVTEVEANAPLAQWLGRVCPALALGKPRMVSAVDLPIELRDPWAEWFPGHGLWIPFGNDGKVVGGLLLLRDVAWRDLELRLFDEWIQTWYCAFRALSRPTLWGMGVRSLLGAPRRTAKRPLVVGVVLLAILLCPVHISVLTPGELVPANPVAIRAPFDGVIRAFLVHTNEAVKANQPLFTYDDSQLSSRLEVAIEAWRTAEAEQRQYSQQALNDAKARGALSGAKGNVEEKRLEMEYLRGQLARSKVLAPSDGIAFVDDPSEWIGRSVNAGQRVMRLAEPQDKEIEAWLPVSDAIILPAHAPVRLYLSSSPLSPVSGNIRYISYDAIRRPDGHYAYRVRAIIDGASDHRVGLKGTVRLTGGRVPLAYWALRRPLAALREFLGM